MMDGFEKIPQLLLIRFSLFESIKNTRSDTILLSEPRILSF